MCIGIGHNLRNCGIDSTRQKDYIMHVVESSHIIAAAASSGELSAVSCGQVKSKDVLYSDD